MNELLLFSNILKSQKSLYLSSFLYFKYVIQIDAKLLQSKKRNKEYLQLKVTNKNECKIMSKLFLSLQLMLTNKKHAKSECKH